MADLMEDKDFKNAISVSVAAGLAHPGIEAEAVEVTSLTVGASGARRALRALEEKEGEAMSLNVEYRIKVADTETASALKDTLTAKKEEFAKTFATKLSEEYAGVQVASVEVQEPSVLVETEVIRPQKIPKEEEKSSGDNTAVIGGVIGVVCGVALLGGLYVMSKKGAAQKEQPAMAGVGTNAADLEQPPAAPPVATENVILKE